jgi:hypothetical protein
VESARALFVSASLTQILRVLAKANGALGLSF